MTRSLSPLRAFSIGMDGHDRAAAFTALDAALAISPSSALTYILGSVMLGWSGEAERAIEWSERGMRLSPFDPWAFAAFDAQAMGHFHRGRYEEACRAAYRSVQANPRTQHHLCAAGRGARKARTAGRSQGGGSAGFGVAPDVSLQPAILRRQLCAGACVVPWRGASCRRPAGITVAPIRYSAHSIRMRQASP